MVAISANKRRTSVARDWKQPPMGGIPQIEEEEKELPEVRRADSLFSLDSANVLSS
jgi:hypothetical protein